jgi:hypothetical protein
VHVRDKDRAERRHSGRYTHLAKCRVDPGGHPDAGRLDIADGVVQNVRSIINPAKLRHLGPLADIRAAMRASHRRA